MKRRTKSRPVAATPEVSATNHESNAAVQDVNTPPPLLSVVIPMFNEADNLERTVSRVAATLRQGFAGAFEILTVSDGSTDGTFERALALAQRPGFECLRPLGYARNRGRGFALRTGFRAARGALIVATDADLSYEPAYILDLLAVLQTEPDIDLVLASAYMPGGGAEGVSARRLWPSRLGNRLLSWFMSPARQRVHTITCVFRAYRRAVLDSMELESEGKDIHLEILSKAVMLGYRFKEVPVVLRARERGASKHKLGRTATSHLVFALFERPILVFGLIGLLLLLAGLFGMAHLFWVWLRYRLDPATHFPLNPERPLMTIIILACLGGIQLISFGIIGTQFVTMRKEIIRIQARLRNLLMRQPPD